MLYESLIERVTCPPQYKINSDWVICLRHCFLTANWSFPCNTILQLSKTSWVITCLLQFTIVSYRVPSRKHDCYGIIKRGQSCLFEASARQDDPKNGKEIWIEGTWRQLQSVSTEWLLSQSPWSQVIFTNLLGKKMQSHIYDFKGRFWNRKVQPSASGLKYSARGSQNPSDLYVITLPSRIPALSWNMVRNNELNYRIKPRPVTRGGGGVHGVRSHPPPQAQKVRILILNIEVNECSRLNWSFKLSSMTFKQNQRMEKAVVYSLGK